MSERKHTIPDGYDGAPANVIVTGKLHKHDELIGVEVEWDDPSMTGTPYATMTTSTAKQVAAAIIEEINHTDGTQLRIVDKHSPQFIVETHLEAMGRQIDDEVKLRLAGKSAFVRWETSYTRRVWGKLHGLVALTADTRGVLSEATGLLKDYWESMHKIYEDRDKARREVTRYANRADFWKGGFRQKCGRVRELEAQLRGAKEQTAKWVKRNAELAEELATARSQLQTTQSELRRTQNRMAFWKNAWNKLRLRKRELEAQLRARQVVEHVETVCRVGSTYKRGDTIVLNPGMLLHVIVSKDATLHVTDRNGGLVTSVTG